MERNKIKSFWNIRSSVLHMRLQELLGDFKAKGKALQEKDFASSLTRGSRTKSELSGAS